MKIKFERPLVPNFIKTDKGLFDIKDLSAKEINNFLHCYRMRLIENWMKRRKNMWNDIFFTFTINIKSYSKFFLYICDLFI